MAISVSFNGATIYKPGSYSSTTIDLGGSFPLGAAGLVAIFGEADAGLPGANVVDISQNYYTADQITQIQQQYRTGPIVDALNFLFSPASDAAIPNGAQQVYVYKTNNSTQASLALSSYGTLTAQEWGIGGNRMTGQIVAVGETPASVTGTTVIGANTATGQTLVIDVNGVQVSHTIGSDSNAAALVAELNAAFTGLTFSTNGAGNLVITRTVDSTAPSQGHGRNFEIEASSTALTALGLTAGLVTAAVEPSVTLQINQTRDNLSESDVVGGNITLTVGWNGSGAGTISVSSTAVTLVGNGVTTVLPLNAYAVLGDLVGDINRVTGWQAATTNSLYNSLPPTCLDKVSSLGCVSGSQAMPAQIKKDLYEVVQALASSSLATLTLNNGTTGLPSAMVETNFSGGTRGGTSSASIVAALNAFTKVQVNSVVPLFSRDATADIADGLTDASSTYTIAAIHQATKTHISLMATTKKRSERQGYMSMKDTFANCQAQAGVLADARMQLLIQDIRQTNSQGSIQWFQPWALACLMAGARGGAPVGTPLTFKYLNCSGIRQTGQAMSTPEANIVIDFDPDTDYEAAIQSGITFLEAPQTGGFRVVVDNTTYSQDDNWVYNRANVLYAADTVAYNLRNRLEDAYVGQKNTISASSVASYAASVLTTFLSQGITVSTQDAPNGYKGLSVQINGDTINLSVVVKLVEGIDFVLSNITVQRASSST